MVRNILRFRNEVSIYSNLQSQWEVRMSSSKRLPYFFNTETKQSSWDAPHELSQDEINELPGAKEHLKSGKHNRAHEGQVRASHLLIKHNGSRRPSSWKEVGDIDYITRFISIAKFLGKYHSFERRSHRNPAASSSRDQWILRKICGTGSDTF